MQPIGGYFEWEFPHLGREIYKHLADANSGRSAFTCILRAELPRKIYMPHYICDSMLNVVQREGIECVKYSIDKNLDPKDMPQVSEGDLFFVVNYFSLKSSLIDKLVAHGVRLVVDNVQAFFAPPITGVSTLYSPRKFFGVPDGGYYHCASKKEIELAPMNSADNCVHLLRRFESGPESGYQIYQENEDWIRGLPPYRMSLVSKAILDSVDYKAAERRREENFAFIHQKLGSFNELTIPSDRLAPLAYPIVVSKPGLREYLQRNKIFVAQFWKEILHRCPQSSDEYFLSEHLIPLPLDHRYRTSELEPMVELVKKYLA